MFKQGWERTGDNSRKWPKNKKNTKKGTSSSRSINKVQSSGSQRYCINFTKNQFMWGTCRMRHVNDCGFKCWWPIWGWTNERSGCLESSQNERKSEFRRTRTNSIEYLYRDLRLIVFYSIFIFNSIDYILFYWIPFNFLFILLFLLNKY